MKLAVILHIYYFEQIPMIAQYLQNLNNANVPYDLIVTTPHKLTAKDLPFTATKIIKTENRGYDIAPFIHAIKSLNTDDYDYIMKLHTKNMSHTTYTQLNNRRLTNHIWAKILWESMLGSKTQISDNLNLLQNNAAIGLIAAKYCLSNSPKNYKHLLSQINEELQKLGFDNVKKLTFAAGTMFLTRANLLKPFLKYDITDFPPTNSKIKDNTLAHVVERLFGAIVEKQGYILAPAKHQSYRAERFIANLKRFFYQKKQTQSGKIIIKICKIPFVLSTRVKTN